MWQIESALGHQIPIPFGVLHGHGNHLCDIDDFCRSFLAREHPQLLAPAGPKKRRASSLSLSEVMTILVWFPASHYRTFKHYYLDSVLSGKRAEFPGLPSYTRFVELIPLTLLPLCAYLQTRKGQ